MATYYDVICDRDVNKCRQLYEALVRVKCKRIETSVTCFLRDSLTIKDYRKEAYRIELGPKGYSYRGFLCYQECINTISVEQFISKIERTVTI